MILTKPQAKAVYDAMKSAVEFGAIVQFKFGTLEETFTNVWECEDGTVKVVFGYRFCTARDEYYPSQEHFAKAYGVE